MIDMTVTIDLEQIKQVMTHYADDVRYVTSQAINQTVKDVQSAIRAKMQGEFTIRRRAFLNQSVKIKPFASKALLSATIGIMDIGGKPTADIFAKFEDGGTKTAQSGRVAVPTSFIRRSPTQIVSSDKKPRSLNKSFVIKDNRGDDLIMQRVAKGKYAGVQVAYVLKHDVPISPRLNFYSTATATINQRFDINFQNAFQRAIDKPHP
jgi:hypothetical protein